MSARTRVLIAGGGVAGVEALLALSDLAGDHVELALLSPDPDLELRPLTVATPFAATHERRRFPLAPLAAEHGATLHEDGLAGVNPDRRVVSTQRGDRLGYDALLVAPGARATPPFPHALTFGREPLIMNDLLRDLEEGYSRRVAFVVPAGVNWPLPAYELALLTARDARGMGMRPEIRLLTPEASPLAVFGRRASGRVAKLLEEAGVEVRCGAEVHVGPSGRLRLEPGGETLDPHRVVALPHLEGPRIPGLPADGNGFIPIDEHARVVGLDGVYCAGDAANYPIKQGGIATQQADAAAQHIAEAAGAPVTAAPLRPVLRGRLFTGGAEQFFVKRVGSPEVRQDTHPLWWPPTKVSGRYLTPWIGSQDPEALPPQPEASVEVEEELPADPLAARRAALSLRPLG